MSESNTDVISPPVIGVKVDKPGGNLATDLFGDSAREAATKDPLQRLFKDKSTTPNPIKTESEDKIQARIDAANKKQQELEAARLAKLSPRERRRLD